MKMALLVDDSKFMRGVLTSILKNHEFNICEASNGVELVTAYEEYKPDIVLLDIVMHEKNGIDGLRDLINKHPEAKVVMCSAMGQKIFVLEALKIGAKDFIVKPIKAGNVLEVVEKVLAD